MSMVSDLASGGGSASVGHDLVDREEQPEGDEEQPEGAADHRSLHVVRELAAGRDMEARPGPDSGAGCREATSHCAIPGQNGLMRVIATRIEPDGTMQRRMVDTDRQSDRRLWEDLAARAVGVSVPYRPAPGVAVYHIRVDDYVVMAAEEDLAGPLLDLVTAVMAMGGEC
jgi:hypothetical protein